MKFSLFIAAISAFITLQAATVDSAAFIKESADGKTFALREYVEACMKAGIKDIALPEGEFLVDKGVAVIGRKGFTIKGAGADKTTLLFQHLKPILENKSKKVAGGVSHGFFIDKCSDFQLRDFSVDFAPLPFVQGTITEVRRNGRELVVKLHKGYPRAHSFFTTGNVSGVLIFDGKTRKFKPGVYENYYRCEIIDKDTYLCKNAAYAEWNIDRIKKGDMVAFGFRSICAFRMERCSSFLLENLTVYSAPGMAYYSMYSKNHRYNNIKIIRGKKPAGATEERLLSSVADGFTHRYALTGPVLENSEFSFMGDDSINISSHIHPVVKIDGRKITIAARYPDMRLELLSGVLNDKSTAVFTSYGSWGISATLKLTGSKPCKADQKLVSEDFKKRWRLRPQQSFYELTLGEDLPSNVKVGDGVYFPDMNGRGFVIRNNYFHDHRAVGLRLMAEDGLVENNRFEHIAFGAVELACSMGVWLESGWSRNIVIRNNKIKSVNEHPVKNDHIGAIASRVEYRGFRPEKYPHCHENIVITGNRIEDTFGDGISLVGAKNVKVENNIITNYNTVPSDERGYKDNLVAGYGICVQQSGDVQIKDNKISEPGRFSRGKSIINPHGRDKLAVADAKRIWKVQGDALPADMLVPQYDPKGGVTLSLNNLAVFTDVNGIGVLNTVPAERGIAGWGNLDWQRRTPSPRKEVSDDGKTVTFTTDTDDMKISKVCRMLAPGKFLITVSGDCNAGDTFSWTALLPKKVFENAIILECDGKGYPLKKISPMSPDCFKGRAHTRDIMRHRMKRMVIQLASGEKVCFELDADAPADEKPRDFHWYMMGGRDKRTGNAVDFSLRNRLRYMNSQKVRNKFKLELTISVLPKENIQK